jgi:hypothetical protein
MTDHAKDGGPAFPTEPRGPVYGNNYDGMSLRAYAAIQLRQPDSGIDWLDDMIRNAQRDDLAGQTLVAMGTWIPLVDICDSEGHPIPPHMPTYQRKLREARAELAYAQAAAMLAAQEDTES